MSRHLTGFDEEVQLGQLGEILENDSVVMTVELTDEDDKTIRPAEEPLWRGVTMLRYDKGRWHRQSKPTQSVVSFQDRATADSAKTIHQKINLEPNDSATLFGIRPMLDATSAHRFAPHLSHQRRHPVSVRSARRRLRIRSRLRRRPERSPAARVATRRVRQALAVDPRGARAAAPRDRRCRWSQTIDGEGRDGHRRPAPASSNRFSAIRASLATPCRWTSIDRSIDPVQDFLVNRKKGHCEYFASALALLLRSVNIPSRVVNGFKGGDWNELTETLNVRQKHAHSWVEAFVGLGPDQTARSGSRSIRRPPSERTGVDRPGRRSRRQLPPVHRCGPPYLGLLHRRLRRRAPGPPALRADATR